VTGLTVTKMDDYKWPDYPRLDYEYRQHHTRYRHFVEQRGLLCQECGGGGGHTEPILDDGTGPWEPCGFCEGTGYVTPHMRGWWLRWKRVLAMEGIK